MELELLKINTSSSNMYDGDIEKKKLCVNCKQILRNIKGEIKFETSDLTEMLENLKTSFKLGHIMDLVEDKVNISSHEIVQSICMTHKKLAINCCNT